MIGGSVPLPVLRESGDRCPSLLKDDSGCGVTQLVSSGTAIVVVAPQGSMVSYHATILE